MFSIKAFSKNLSKLLVLIVFLGFNHSSKAVEQDSVKNNTFSMSGQFRPKFELRDGAFRPLMKNEKPAALVSDRIRLTFDYAYKNVFSLRITPQAVSVWGQATMTQGAEDKGSKFSIFETWAQVYATPEWSFKLGRQIISLDDERFFGELDWAQGGRVHDALSILYKKEKYELRGYFAFNQNYRALYNNNLSNPAGSLFSTNNALPYKWMQTVWASVPIKEHSKITFLVSNLGFQNAIATTKDTVTNYTQTFGTNYNYNGSKLNVSVAAYYQMGKDLANIKNQGYMWSAALGYNINKKWNIGIGSDMVSGNNVGATQKKSHIFTPYFHTGHKFYGFMDYFYSGNPHKNAGLSDNYLKVNFKTEKGLGLSMAFHQFVTPNKIIDGATKFSKNLGQELDLGISYKIHKFVGLIGGYSFYLANSNINFLKNTPNAKVYQQWMWFGLNITPTFFKTNF